MIKPNHLLFLPSQIKALQQCENGDKGKTGV